jgi:serine/threonine protein kinase
MKYGGKLIESGGFGCIFRPQLKCDPRNVIAGDNEYIGEKGVTKILKKKYGLSEYNEIKRFIPILKTIPNYNNYFIISGYTICKPAPLTDSDLIDYDKVKCSSLRRQNISSKNINMYLNDLLAINMPYGGVDASKFIQKNIYDRNAMVLFNNKMIDLLVNAIIPMNKKGVFHGDLKAYNILTNIENNKLLLRIIDWGLSSLYQPNVRNESQITEIGFTDDWKYIPSNFRNRPFQYNVPFSSILFSEKFNNIYTNFLISKNGKYTNQDIKEFVVNFMQEINSLGGLVTFNSIFNTDTKLTSSISSDLQNNIIIQPENYKNIYAYIYRYIYEILIKFTNPFSFNVLGYFSSVYTKNLDVWGFVMTYVTVCEAAINKEYIVYNNIVKNNMKSLLKILLKYSATPINTSEVTNTLLTFNKQIEMKKKKIIKNKKTIKKKR